MKRTFTIITLFILVISLTGCIPSDPLVIETERLVEVEKEVVVIQTETEVVTVETNIVIPSGTIYPVYLDEDEVHIHFVFGSEVYVVVIQEKDPILEDPFFELTRIDYYKNGGLVKGYLVPEEDIEGAQEDALGRTLEEYVEDFLVNTTFRTAENTYIEFENYYLLNPEE